MILIVEDEQAVLDLTRAVLERRGYATEITRTGALAIECFEKNPDGISLVLADVVLADMRGPELVSRLRQIRPAVKVVFMSGYSEAVLGDMFQNEKFEVLRKPFGLDALLDRVQAALGTSEPHSES